MLGKGIVTYQTTQSTCCEHYIQISQEHIYGVYMLFKAETDSARIIFVPKEELEGEHLGHSNYLC